MVKNLHHAGGPHVIRGEQAELEFESAGIGHDVVRLLVDPEMDVDQQ